mmetsp:Transcript_21856/g.32567  ORF Transcript_21856/g.32567 Transcript_21856/m.32567 type:complete len:530 (+) Transcript_21856:1274-2863(+)
MEKHNISTSRVIIRRVLVLSMVFFLAKHASSKHLDVSGNSRVIHRQVARRTMVHLHNFRDKIIATEHQIRSIATRRFSYSLKGVVGSSGGSGIGGNNTNNNLNPPSDSDDGREGESSRKKVLPPFLSDQKGKWEAVVGEEVATVRYTEPTWALWRALTGRLVKNSFRSLFGWFKRPPKRTNIIVSAAAMGAVVPTIFWKWPDITKAIHNPKCPVKREENPAKIIVTTVGASRTENFMRELDRLCEKGRILKAKALYEKEMKTLTLSDEQKQHVFDVLKKAANTESLISTIRNDEGWSVTYDNSKEKFKTLYLHNSDETVHHIKMKAIFNASAIAVLSVLREFDLTKTWNAHMKGAAQLGFPNAVSLQAYGAGFMPWGPLKPRDVVFEGHGVDALDEHGCIVLAFESMENDPENVPSLTKKCVRAEFYSSGVMIEPLPSPSGTNRVMASMILNGDPKLAVVPGWLVGFGLKVFAPMVKRQTDDLLIDIENNPNSPYKARQVSAPQLYAMLDERVELYKQNAAKFSVTGDV